MAIHYRVETDDQGAPVVISDYVESDERRRRGRERRAQTPDPMGGGRRRRIGATRWRFWKRRTGDASNT